MDGLLQFTTTAVSLTGVEETPTFSVAVLTFCATGCFLLIPLFDKQVRPPDAPTPGLLAEDDVRVVALLMLKWQYGWLHWWL